MHYVVSGGTSKTLRLGPFIDSTTLAAKTALSLAYTDIRLSKNGGAFAAKHETTAPVHDENGYYTVLLDDTDTGTYGMLRVHCQATGAFPVWVNVWVVRGEVSTAFQGSGYYLPTMALAPYPLFLGMRAHGQTSNILRFELPYFNGNSPIGKGSLTTASSGLAVTVYRDTDATATTFSGSNLESITTLGTYAAPSTGKCRFKETDVVGRYELQLADSWFAGAGQRKLFVSVTCDAIPIPARFEVGIDAQTLTQTGYLDKLQYLPAATAGSNGGLPTCDASNNVGITQAGADKVWDTTLATGAGGHTTTGTAGYNAYYARLYSTAASFSMGKHVLAPIVRGSTSVIIRTLLANGGNGATHGLLTGYAYNSSSLAFYLMDQDGNKLVSYASASSTLEDIATVGTYQAPTSGKMRFKEVQSTFAPGLYEIHLPDTVYASAANALSLVCKVGTVYVGHTIIPITDAPAAIPSASAIRTELEGSGTKLTNVDTVATQLSGMLETDGAVKRWTQNALETAPGGTTGVTADVNVVSISGSSTIARFLKTWLQGLKRGGR